MGIVSHLGGVFACKDVAWPAGVPLHVANISLDGKKRSGDVC